MSIRALLVLVACLVAAPLRLGAADRPTVTVLGDSAPRYGALDAAVASYMGAQFVPNAELAISVSGRTVFSHAYTKVADATSPATPKTIFRLASNSKAWTNAAIQELMAHGALSGNERVFDYLGIHEPLPEGTVVADARAFDINVRQLLGHRAGWDREIAHFDPMHAMRYIALQTNLGRPVQPVDVARYMLSRPLQHPPGSTYAYCNVCYMLLGMVIEKASGQMYLAYVQQHVAQPIGVTDLEISPTENPRLPGEVADYASEGTGLSPLHLDSNVPVPDPNGGDGEIREVASASGGLATSAESMLKLMEHHAIWGLGPPPDSEILAREGAAAGTNSYARQGRGGVNYVIIVNRRNEDAFRAFHENIDRALDAITP